MVTGHAGAFSVGSVLSADSKVEGPHINRPQATFQLHPNCPRAAAQRRNSDPKTKPHSLDHPTLRNSLAAATWSVPLDLARRTGQPANLPPEGCLSPLPRSLLFPLTHICLVFPRVQVWANGKRKKKKSSVNPSDYAMCKGERKPESFSGCFTDCHKLSSNTRRERGARISIEGFQLGNSGCALFFREPLYGFQAPGRLHPQKKLDQCCF